MESFENGQNPKKLKLSPGPSAGQGEISPKAASSTENLAPLSVISSSQAIISEQIQKITKAEFSFVQLSPILARPEVIKEVKMQEICQLQQLLLNIQSVLYCVFNESFLMFEDLHLLVLWSERIDLLLAHLSVFFKELNNPDQYSAALFVKKMSTGLNVMFKTAIPFDVLFIPPATHLKTFIPPSPINVTSFTSAVHGLNATLKADSSSSNLSNERKAHFNLIFATGSNVQPISLRFTLQIAPNITLSTHLFEQIIVRTNSVQWKQAQEILLKKRIFGDLESSSFSRCCNFLQLFYLDATHQNLNDVSRPLSLHDFSYFYNLLFGEKYVTGTSSQLMTLEKWDSFWNWFGSCVHLIRSQICVSDMMGNCLIGGFLSKTEAESLLAGLPDGTFLVRFSETNIGSFAIAFSLEGTIHHTLVKGEQESKISLLTFISKFSELKQFLVATQQGNEFKLRTVPKELIITKYQRTKEKQPQPVTGYESMESFSRDDNSEGNN